MIFVGGVLAVLVRRQNYCTIPPLRNLRGRRFLLGYLINITRLQEKN